MKISKGNQKVGKIPNFSMTPIKSCDRSACKSCGKDCYALKSHRQYPAVRAAWDGNFNEMITEDGRKAAFDQIDAFMAKSKPAYFRIHVAGDFLDADYMAAWLRIAIDHPCTKFLAFTKCYDMAINAVNIPSNFSMVLSAWPGLALPENRSGLSIAWMRDKAGVEDRIPAAAIECPGNCDTCGACWGLSKHGLDVVFNQH
jgi:hypothetical protein